MIGRVFLRVVVGGKWLLALWMLIGTTVVWPQAVVAPAANLAGDWQGTLHGTSDLRVVFRFSKGTNGVWRALVYSLDQKPDPMSIPVVDVQGDLVSFQASYLSGSYSGKLSADEGSMTGTWAPDGTPAGRPAPPDSVKTPGKQVLTLLRATKATGWDLPPDRLPASMPANADPSFEVTTIKPHDMNQPGDGYRWRDARKFSATMPVRWLVEYVYGIHDKQLIGAPDWVSKDIYDFVGVPDIPGLPSEQQRINMMRKMLEERCQLKVHVEKRSLPAYVLTVAKNGPTMTPSAIRDPGASLFGRMGPHGGILIPARNTTMGDFIRLLHGVLDRPVVDETGLTGQFDFDLNWMPDQSQFGGHFPVSEDADAPPELFTAIQQQIGLKLSPAKSPVDVIVIDHVERPSAN